MIILNIYCYYFIYIWLQIKQGSDMFATVLSRSKYDSWDKHYPYFISFAVENNTTIA